MAERTRVTFQDVRTTFQNLRAAFTLARDTTPMTELGNGAVGDVVVRGRRRRDPLDIRHARDTRIVYGPDGNTDVLQTDRYTTSPSSTVGETNVLVVDRTTGVVTGSNVMTLQKDNWKEPLVLFTPDPTVVVERVAQLTRRLTTEQSQLGKELFSYDPSEFGQD